MSLVSDKTIASSESSHSAVSWASIFAGAVAATAITLVLLLLGSGLGLSMVSPWSGESSSAATVGVTAAIWLVLVQWLSAGFGGYITGRLRTKWAGVHDDEIYFRDTAHGFLSWAVATVLVVGFLSSAAGSAVSTATQTAGLAAGAAGAVGATAASNAGSDFGTSYMTDSLLRPADPRNAAPGQNGDDASAQVGRILMNGVAAGEIAADDRTYLEQLVAARTGLSEADAKARVDAILTRAQEAKVAAQEAADAARKAAATTALLGTLSLLIGAFIAAVGGALGGRQRDEDPDLIAVRR